MALGLSMAVGEVSDPEGSRGMDKWAREARWRGGAAQYNFTAFPETQGICGLNWDRECNSVTFFFFWVIIIKIVSMLLHAGLGHSFTARGQ